MTSPALSRAYEEVDEALARAYAQDVFSNDPTFDWEIIGPALQNHYRKKVRPFSKAAISAFLSSLAKDEEPMKLLPSHHRHLTKER